MSYFTVQQKISLLIELGHFFFPLEQGNHCLMTFVPEGLEVPNVWLNTYWRFCI